MMNNVFIIVKLDDRELSKCSLSKTHSRFPSSTVCSVKAEKKTEV